MDRGLVMHVLKTTAQHAWQAAAEQLPIRSVVPAGCSNGHAQKLCFFCQRCMHDVFDVCRFQARLEPRVVRCPTLHQLLIQHFSKFVRLQSALKGAPREMQLPCHACPHAFMPA
jgi:hypothetical protein